MMNLNSQNLHSDYQARNQHGSTHQPVFHSVAYGYSKVNDLISVFQNKKSGFVYGRQNNPTVQALANKITLWEDGVGSVLFSTGMAAIASTCLSLLKKGDHLITSQFLFGNTRSLFVTLSEIGVRISFVDATNAENIKKAETPATKMVFVETIANPVTQISDLKKIGQWCHKKKHLYIVDNTMTTPLLCQPKKYKAHLVINSLTKYVGGHGQALGGAVTDSGLYDWSCYHRIFESYRKFPVLEQGLLQIKKKGLRDMGASLSPDDAHLISMGLETMPLRVQKSCENAQQLALFLQKHKAVAEVFYPGLSKHPQHLLCQQLFLKSGAILSFSLKKEKNHLHFLDRLKLVILSSNLGDTRTLAIPVAQTIYFEMGQQERIKMGIAESLVRISVGIEEIKDLVNDFKQALA